ncbi:MAG: polysaccharide deacetylase family protein, partial [Opitutaceae bacterium]
PTQETPAGGCSHRREYARQAIAWSSLLAFLVALLLVRVSLPAAVAVLAVPHALFFFATLCPNTALCGPLLKRFAAEGREVWLTFDDGPDPQETPRVLALLAQHRARATFFLVGRNAESHPAMVRAILAAGHGIANHSHTHPTAFFWAYLPSAAGREIDRCAKVLAAAMGAPPRLFRGPVGWHPPLLYPVLRRRGLQPVGWTARGLDRAGIAPERAARRLLCRLRPGAIFMLHPERRNRQGENTGLAALEIVLREIDRAGYRCVLPAFAQQDPLAKTAAE